MPITESLNYFSMDSLVYHEKGSFTRETGKQPTHLVMHPKTFRNVAMTSPLAKLHPDEAAKSEWWDMKLIRSEDVLQNSVLLLWQEQG